ncbi:uncharacterized protein A1O9_00353 [Exophiala aquamarina CBS 119918]|uniref:N-acetyltransferase domain-containing protein n=1 Tax=Exophiala aquamarina CBS 119918 TaxID=1182545 RepID=A0A072PR90_9EURO|nr:uncharacterized protein A1O9_00353 [Exophiala aquamarina CBS 119918]KEF62381.1 hypothetical protein A1O9_00353 [Exophiala aquamarina CBS 119918]
MAYLYEQAQDDIQKATIVVVKEHETGEVVGSAILYHPDSILGRLFPLENGRMGGVTGMMISDNRQPELIAQALLVGAAEQLKEREFAGCCVFLADQEPLRKMLTELGFQKVYEFLGMEQQV